MSRRSMPYPPYDGPSGPSISVDNDSLAIDGHTEEHAYLAVLMFGPVSLEIVREASRAGCSELSPSETMEVISSLLPPVGFAQDSPDGTITIGVPGEKWVRVPRSALREIFFHRLLSREVMCA